MHFLLILATMAGGPGDAPRSTQEPTPVAIRATGIGRPPPGMSGRQAWLMARRAAELNAARNLAIKVNGRGRRAHPMDGASKVSTVSMAIRGFQYLPARTMSDGRVLVTVEMPQPQVRRRTVVHTVSRPRGWGIVVLKSVRVRTQRSSSCPVR